MKQLLKTLAFVCLCVPMWGQGYRYDSNAFTSANNVPPGSQSTLFTIPFAKITVCAYPDNGGQPCTNTVPIYQDPALTVTAQNPITADVHGRFGFWKAAGFYTFSVVSPGGEFLGTYIISLGGAGGETTLALTTNGTSGPSTLTGDPASGYLLNVPDYQTAFQQQVIPPVTGQYVVIYPTSVVASGLQRATPVTTPGSIGAQLSFRIGCGGLAPCSAVFTWSGFTLPSYVNPANVTAVYTFGNYAGSEIILSHSIYQSSGPSGDAFPSSVIPAIAMQQSTELTEMTGAQVTGSSIQWTFGRTLNVPIGIIPSANIASVGMIVYYSGPAPPTNTSIIVDPPLFFNGTSLDLGIDPLSINFLQPLLVQHLPDPTLSTGDIYQVTDGTSSSDCTTGGGSTVNLCRSNGTIWSVYSSGGGGSGTVSGQANGVIPLATASTTIGAQSHLDDGISTAATITSSEPIAVAGSTHGVSIPAGPAVAGAAGKVIYASDATSGFAEVNENNTGLSRVCTAFNYGSICPSAGSSPLTTKGDLYTFSTANARLGVGADGLVLSADSTQATGLKWIAATGTGNTTSTALTTNFFPKANGANSIINSLVSESGGAFNVPEPVAVSDGTGNGGIFDATEGTAPSATATHDILYADSTSHCMKYSANGGAFACIGGSGIPTSPSNALVKINGSGGAASSLSDSGTALSGTEPLTLTTSGNVPLTLTSSSTSNTAFILSNSNVTGEWIFEELGTASPAGMFFFNFFNATHHIPIGWDKTTLNTMLNGSSVLGWTSGSPISTSLDTGISRDSAGVIDIGNGTAGNASGSIKATNLTLTGTCTGCGGGGSGSLVLLEEHTASSSADLEFTTRNVTGQSGASFQSDYDVYQVQIVNITPATNLVVPEWQFSTNGGSTWDASSVYKSVNFQMYSASGPSSPAVTTFFSPISQDAISNVAANGGEVGQFLVFNPLSTTVNKRISGLEYHFSTTDVMTNFSGTYQSTGAVNAMRLLMGSGNIATGTIRLYGVAK